MQSVLFRISIQDAYRKLGYCPWTILLKVVSFMMKIKKLTNEIHGMCKDIQYSPQKADTSM